MSEVALEQPNIVLSGIEKASVLLVTLGADTSSSILQQLTPDEIERLAGEILRLKKVNPVIRKQVLEETRKAVMDNSSFGGLEYATTILSQVFGEAKAREVLNKLSSGADVSTLRWIKGVPPRQLALAIKGERPQIIALVLGHLPPELAAQTLSALPEEVRGDVVLRLTTMQPTDPEVIRNLNQTLLARLSSSDNAAFTEVGGSESVVHILNNVDRSTERKIFEYLMSVDEVTATHLKENMFVFEDILALDGRAIQAILREVPQEDLRLALKGTPDNVKELFLSNMSNRAAETLKEDLESSSPSKLKDVEAAQTRIVAVALQLDESGEISLRDTGDEVVV